jgi:hypothetical protein
MEHDERTISSISAIPIASSGRNFTSFLIAAIPSAHPTMAKDINVNRAPLAMVAENSGYVGRKLTTG